MLWKIKDSSESEQIDWDLSKFCREVGGRVSIETSMEGQMRSRTLLMVAALSSTILYTISLIAF